MDPDFSNAPLSVKIGALTISSVLFAVWSVLLTLVIFRIKCNLEKSGIVLIIAYSINAGLGVIFDAIRIGIESQRISKHSLLLRCFVLIQSVAERTFLFIIFCYILEMREVRNKLNCNSFEEYKKKVPSQKRL
jgi:hypothetical protein